MSLLDDAPAQMKIRQSALAAVLVVVGHGSASADEALTNRPVGGNA